MVSHKQCGHHLDAILSLLDKSKRFAVRLDHESQCTTGLVDFYSLLSKRLSCNWRRSHSFQFHTLGRLYLSKKFRRTILLKKEFSEIKTEETNRFSCIWHLLYAVSRYHRYTEHREYLAAYLPRIQNYSMTRCNSSKSYVVEIGT